MMMISKRERWFIWFILSGVCLSLSCERADPTAPTDSTITVSANPQTVVVPSGGGVGTSRITATIRSKNGTPLPDQSITFTTTAGTLDPPAETLLVSDHNGQAESILNTTTSATVMARSGGITGTTQLNTAPGNLSQFILNVAPNELTTCNDMLTLTAEVRTTTGDPVQNVIVIFDEVPPSTISGNFSPGSQVLSDGNGNAMVRWTPQASVCASKCQFATGDPNDPTRGTCRLFFTASDTVGTFKSVEFEITDNIP